MNFLYLPLVIGSFASALLLGLSIPYLKWVVPRSRKATLLVFSINVLAVVAVGPGMIRLLSIVLYRCGIVDPSERDIAFYTYFVTLALVGLCAIFQMLRGRSVNNASVR